MPLSELKIKSAKPKEKQYKLTDGEGMYLLIRPNGSKYWQMKYRYAGKEKTLSIGKYPLVTLAEAREARLNARKQLKEGNDPSQCKQQEKLKKQMTVENSFEKIAKEWLEQKKGAITERHYRKIKQRLEYNIFPYIGKRPIIEIEPVELLSCLRKMEDRGVIETTHNVKQCCGQIFRYAIATSRAKYDITAGLQGVLKTAKRTHYPSLKENELSDFLYKLNTFGGDKQTSFGIKLIMLTFVRTNELRGSRWVEFNLDKQEWHIPEERMKMREKHIVPLSKQSLQILNELREINGNQEFLFPNRNNSKTFISENTLLYAMYRMGYRGKATPHGFRSTASTVLNERGFNRDHIERQLAHAPRDEVRAAYNYAQYLPERHKMMQWWADFLDEQEGKYKPSDT